MGAFGRPVALRYRSVVGAGLGAFKRLGALHEGPRRVAEQDWEPCIRLSINRLDSIDVNYNKKCPRKSLVAFASNTRVVPEPWHMSFRSSPEMQRSLPSFEPEERHYRLAFVVASKQGFDELGWPKNGHLFLMTLSMGKK